MTPSPSVGSHLATGAPANPGPPTATSVAIPSPSSRNSEPSTSPSRRDTSLATWPNTSSSDGSVATSVATRRKASCSRASRSARSRDSVFAIAVAISSVNWPRRTSVSGGSGRGCIVPAAMKPQRRPLTTIGVPTTHRSPTERAVAPTAPLAAA
jgi:hypothetical protein